MTATLDHLRDEALALIRGTPDLAAFAPVPQNLVKTELAPSATASVERLLANPGASIMETAAFTQSVLDAAPDANWRQTYTEAQVGADFLAHYGWMELSGPTGQFHCEDARAYVAFWGEHLDHEWHWHEAEEIYFVAAGEALFKAEGEVDASVAAGQTRTHS
jgi:mannose-6-phosphate isomerase-like protein (cupin superfamily)